MSQNPALALLNTILRGIARSCIGPTIKNDERSYETRVTHNDSVFVVRVYQLSEHMPDDRVIQIREGDEVTVFNTRTGARYTGRVSDSEESNCPEYNALWFLDFEDDGTYYWVGGNAEWQVEDV